MGGKQGVELEGEGHRARQHIGSGLSVGDGRPRADIAAVAHVQTGVLCWLLHGARPSIAYVSRTCQWHVHVRLHVAFGVTGSVESHVRA